jgi:hypothetical protein
MRTFFLSFCSVLLFSLSALAQPKTKSIVKQPASELKRLLTGTGLPFNIVNDSLAVIPYKGEHIENYQVIVQRNADLYIIYTSLSEALPNKLTEAQYKYLLKQNDHFDVIKIGLAEDNTVYLRADLYKGTVTTPILKRIITQVANVTNIIGGDLK